MKLDLYLNVFYLPVPRTFICILGLVRQKVYGSLCSNSGNELSCVLFILPLCLSYAG